MAWVKVREPVERPKGSPGLSRPDGKIRGFGTLTTPYVGCGLVDMPNHTLGLWFEDLGWQRIHFSIDIQDYDLFVHSVGGVPTLKCWLRRYFGDGSNDAEAVLLDCGFEWH